MDGFSVSYRNPGHWDVHTYKGRAFTIRGEPGGVVVRDQREFPLQLSPHNFKTVGAAMNWIADELMHEEVTG